MPRRGFWFTVTVKDDERAFLTSNGCFKRLLGPGRYTTFDPRFRLAAEVVKVARAEITPERAFQFQRTHPKLAAEHFE
ncbi:MAG: slipin family protein, partial [Alphaproteobacteria bacterium]